MTVHKGDECQMVGPAQPFYWKVLGSSCSEAAMPSVCFLVPPPNQEAQEAIARCVVLGMQLERVVSGRSPDPSDCAPDLPGWRPSTRPWWRCGTSCTRK